MWQDCACIAELPQHLKLFIPLKTKHFFDHTSKETHTL